MATRSRYRFRWPAPPQKLPEVLSRSELANLFARARHIKARTVLMTAYGCGLRSSDLCHLQLGDIDSHADRMFVLTPTSVGACVRMVAGASARWCWKVSNSSPASCSTCCPQASR